MENVSTMVRCKDDDGLLQSGGHRVEGVEQPVEDMAIGGAGNEHNSEDCMDDSGMVLEGGGKAPTSC